MLRQTDNVKLLLLFLIFKLAVRSVEGQTTDAICGNNATTSWLFNSANESPCLTWSKLQSLCIPSTSYINVPPLQPGLAYNPASSESELGRCQCNVVAYNLMAGCSFCQLGTSGTWLDEGRYKASCGNYAADGLGFGQSVLILPAFSFQSWNNAKWDAGTASAAAALPSPTQNYSTTLSRSFPSSATQLSPSVSSSSSNTGPFFISTPFPAPSSTPTSTPGSSKKQPWGIIIGAIIGSVLLLIALLLLWRKLRSRKKRERGKETARTAFRSTTGEGGHRETEFLADPSTFRSPRTAPFPSTPLEREGGRGRYTTTQERIRDRPISTGSSLMQRNAEQPESGVGTARESTFSRRDGGSRLYVTNSSPDSSVLDRYDADTSVDARPANGRKLYPISPRTDFSEVRPYSATTPLRLNSRSKGKVKIVKGKKKMTRVEKEKEKERGQIEPEPRNGIPRQNRESGETIPSPLTPSQIPPKHFHTHIPRTREAPQAESRYSQDSYSTSASERILPSLYDPPSGALRYSTSRRSSVSARSLGGRERWESMALPPLPFKQ